MLWIFLSICCSIVVSVMLKLARRYEIDVYQAVVWNYSTAILLTSLLLWPRSYSLNGAPWGSYITLGLLLPAIFVVLGISIKYSGIVRTEVAQRMSLLIPILAAFLFFGEHETLLKFVGILVGFIAIILTIPRSKHSGRRSYNPIALGCLLVVFVGFGVIDVLFKNLATSTAVSYNTSLFYVFVLSFGFSLVGLIYQVATGRMRFSWLHIPIGWVLGIAHFGNILFYITAHKSLASQPSMVFSAINIGVIVLGALTGMIIFKEKLTLLNKAGIVVAIAAVVIMAYAGI
jgi:drug/metabolite transporter (DMT)-like permease